MSDLVLVATEERAPPWARALEATDAGRGAPVQLVLAPATVTAGFTRTAVEAVQRHPGARVVVALPPRATRHLLAAIGAARVDLLVDPPGPSGLPVPPGLPSTTCFAYEWQSLVGPERLREVVRRRPVEHARFELAGCPAATSDDPLLVLEHALSLARFVFGPAELQRAELGARDTELVVELRSARGGRVELRTTVGAPRARATLVTEGRSVSWRLADGAEELEHEQAAPRRVRRFATSPSCERALRRASTGVSDENGLAVARELSSLVRRVEDALPHAVAVPASRFALARAVRAEAEGDSVLALGLEGELPAGRAPEVTRPVLPPGPLEAWAFRAGIKPVVFLTLPPERVPEALARFEGAHVEQRTRKVLVESQDRWVDERNRGESRVELYVSRSPELAREAATLQAGGDPSRSAARLGELMGYPGCCVAAFQRQENRSNNTGNRYATAARTSDSPWCFELNNTALMLVPFFPCSYRCEPARAFARAVLREIGATLPDAAARIETELRRPVLYFEHGELVSFEGRMTAPGRIDYARVLVPEGASPPLRRLAAALGAGDALTLGDESLSVLSGTSTSFALRRLDPGLGFVAGWDGPQG